MLASTQIDHFDYSDSESEYESDSGDDYEEHRIDMVQGNPQTNRKYSDKPSPEIVSVIFNN